MNLGHTYDVSKRADSEGNDLTFSYSSEYYDPSLVSPYASTSAWSGLRELDSLNTASGSNSGANGVGDSNYQATTNPDVKLEGPQIAGSSGKAKSGGLGVIRHRNLKRPTVPIPPDSIVLAKSCSRCRIRKGAWFMLERAYRGDIADDSAYTRVQSSVIESG